MVTRSHKFNDKDHSGLADGTGEHIPKFFAKHGFPDADPKKTKKNGAGKANWGNAGDEAIDQDFNFANPRRRSNSSSLSSNLDNLKTKFEVNEPEPVFEESMGPEEEEEKMESSSSGTSIDEGKAHKDM
ncbi:ATPase-stabilizing factor 15 kDa protein [Achaetomium macrosporum]|uniref:ATPase-stabilizing factor 15 kDa protein n=1 Tax=Achaetomium macrosporum TaxID=79813 RepID=A0AAN7C9T0_9PEZI|nr:ATPase-stabilizing factor 15 kDa protein [Achaetomium macrosporum]